MADLCIIDEHERKVEEGVDYFDLLPDPIVIVIFNKVFDAKSLYNCLVVSKRFAALVGDVESIHMKVNSPKGKQPSEELTKIRNGSKNFFKNFLSKFVMKPLNFIQQVFLSQKKGSSSSGYENGVDMLNWVGNALKNFDDVKSIKLEVPCYGGIEIELNKKDSPLFRWEAEFGKEMEKCVILGSTSVVQNKNFCKKNLGYSNDQGNDDINNIINDDDDDDVLSDEDLRFRIIWIISCLIASSGRHNLMKQMVCQCSKLIDAIIVDVGNQGKVYMNSEQIKLLRDSIDSTQTNKDDETVSALAPSGAPAAVAGPEGANAGGVLAPRAAHMGNLVMKLWYVKELELPSCGKVMKGATLVVIKPEVKFNGGGHGGEKDKESSSGIFEGDDLCEEAIGELLTRKVKRVYRLEMNSL